MCCICPPAIQAIFCLWVQSGFSQGTVAGALTFFPPDPPLYQFQRLDKDGDPLPDNDDESATNDNNNNNNNNKKSKKKSKNENKNGEIDRMNQNTADTTADEYYSNNQADYDTTNNSSRSNRNNNNNGSAEVVTDGNYHAREGQTREIVRSPAQQFTDQAKALKKRGKTRNARDTIDAAKGVTYKLVLDPRLQPPRINNGGTVEAVKIPTGEDLYSDNSNSSNSNSNNSGTNSNQKKKNNRTHCAAIVYKVPAANADTNSEGRKTMTIIYSHGNATDIGAMYPLQVILSNSLECNVVSYDYSGYGESGGVAMEANTYTDIASVYEWTLKNVCGGDESRIVLYGQSVGSGPCCHLAKQVDGLGGMVLHSPFMSGMRVLTPSR